MDNELLKDLGPAFIGAYMMIRLIMDYVIKLLPNKNAQDEKAAKEESRKILSDLKSKLDHMNMTLHELHGWHDKENTEGVKIWYTPKSLENSMSQISTLVQKQTQMIEVWIAEQKAINRARGSDGNLH